MSKCDCANYQIYVKLFARCSGKWIDSYSCFIMKSQLRKYCLFIVSFTIWKSHWLCGPQNKTKQNDTSQFNKKKLIHAFCLGYSCSCRPNSKSIVFTGVHLWSPRDRENWNLSSLLRSAELNQPNPIREWFQTPGGLYPGFQFVDEESRWGRPSWISPSSVPSLIFFGGKNSLFTELYSVLLFAGKNYNCKAHINSCRVKVHFLFPWRMYYPGQWALAFFKF